MSLLRAPILNDIAFITAVTEAEYNAEIESTNDTPNLALTSKLYGVSFAIILGKWTTL